MSHNSSIRLLKDAQDAELRGNLKEAAELYQNIIYKGLFRLNIRLLLPVKELEGVLVFLLLFLAIIPKNILSNV